MWDEAEIVKFIYEQYANGLEVKHIRKQLNEKGITHKGKPFAHSTLYRMLKNEKYIGIFRHEDEIFDNIYPQIISNELFDKVKSRQTCYKYGKKSISVEYLFCRSLTVVFIKHCLKSRSVEVCTRISVINKLLL